MQFQVNTENKNILLKLMGNQLCDAVDKEGEYKRHDIKMGAQLMSPIGEKQSAHQNQSQLNQETLQQGDLANVKYKDYMIKCSKTCLKYSKPGQSSRSKTPIINGQVKVYKSQPYRQLVYQGEMRNSKFDVYGRMYKRSQLIYEGDFKNGLFDGWGLTPEYSGQFREGVYDGYGIYCEYQDKDRKVVTFYYEGYFQNGLYSGSGVLIKGVKLPIEQIDRIHAGQGIFQYLNSQIEHGMEIIKKYGAKEIYIGQFSNGFRHGFGRLFTETMEFSGQFSHNLYHGLGTIYNIGEKGKKVIQTVFRMGKQIKQ